MRYIVTALLLMTMAFPTLGQSKPKPFTIKQTKPPDADPQYFPIGVFNKNPGLSEWVARWYASELRALEEPSLYKNENSTSSEVAKNADAEAYRITILPTWGNPIAIRVQRHGELYSLSARRLDGQAGYDPGKLVESKDITLNLQDSQRLSILIQNVDFFQMPKEDNISGMDGDEWIIEGVSKGNYHVAWRWCAQAYDPGKRNLIAFLDLCKFLVDESTLSERPKNKGHKLI